MSASNRSVSLLLGQTKQHAVQQKCIDHLTNANSSTKVLFVTHQPRTEWVDRFADSRKFGGIDDIAVVEVHDGNSMTSLVPPDVPVELEVVESTSNLTDVSLTISDVVGRWRDRTDDLHFSVCFDSLTYFVTQYQLERVFRFSHAVKQYLLRAGGHGHFHLHSDAHDEAVTETFREIFPDIDGGSNEEQ